MVGEVIALRSIATRLPRFRITAAQTKSYLERIQPRDAVERVSRMVDKAAIRERPIVVPVDELLRCDSVEARNEIYVREAVALGEAVARAALDFAHVRPQEITSVVSVSCTGYMLPSFDAHLVERLGLSSCGRRLPINSLGCSAGVAALGIANELLRQRSTGAVLIADVELCSLLLEAQEPAPADLLGSVLFGDAAAAAVLTAGDGRGDGEAGIEVLASHSAFWANTNVGLGMEATNRGWRLVLSPRLPGLIRAKLRDTVGAFLRSQGLSLRDLRFHVLHPGGPKILQAITAALQLGDDAIRPAWDVWERHGNLSSTTIFFMLDELRASARPANGDLGLVFAPGPGPCCEMVLVRWHDGPCEPVVDRAYAAMAHL